MDNSKNLIISAIVSVTIYLCVIFFFILYVMKSDVRKIDSVSKSTVIQLDIVMDQPKEVEKKAVSSQIKSQKTAQDVVKKSKSSSAKKRSDLKSLFAKVSTKSPSVAKKKITNTKKSTIASRYRSKFEKERKTKSLTLNKLQNKKAVSMPTKAASEAKNESDPYYSKIYDLMYERWTPVVFNEDTKARVLITITNNGTFSYQFIQYSDNIGFDNQLKKFLEDQCTKRFPVNPNGKTTQIEILFQAKG